MSIFGLAIAVLAATAYVLYMIVSYFGQSSALNLRLEELKAGTQRRKSRLAEYEQRVVFLQNGIPQRNQLIERLDRWNILLRQQKEQLEAQRARDLEDGGGRTRKEAILERFIEARSRRKGL